MCQKLTNIVLLPKEAVLTRGTDYVCQDPGNMSGVTIQAVLTVTEGKHAAYVLCLSKEASEMSIKCASQLQTLQAQHSTELSQLAALHQADMDCLQHNLADTQMLLQEQHSDQCALQQEDHKLMISQLATFLAWERDDIAWELCTSHEAAFSSLCAQHEQQLDSVQAKMLEQNVDVLQCMCVHSNAAAESLVACSAELTQGLQQLHSAQTAVQDITCRYDVEHVKQTHAQALHEMQADHQAQMAEASMSFESALNEALTLAAQDTELATQSQLTEASAGHAVELAVLRSNHDELIAQMSAERERDQAEALCHLKEAAQQLSDEHAQSVSVLDSLWADKQANERELQKQQLLDLSMQHDAAVDDLNMHFYKRLEAAQAQHDQQLNQMSAEHESTQARLRQSAETERQQHSVQLVNLQLQFEQTEHKLRTELVAAKAVSVTATQQYQDLRVQMKVT